MRVTIQPGIGGVQGPGGTHLEGGQTYDLPEPFAWELVLMGRAQHPAGEPTPTPPGMTDFLGPPFVQTQDPKPRTRQ